MATIWASLNRPFFMSRLSGSENTLFLLMTNSFRRKAYTLRDALVQARIELQLLFWQELEQEMRRLKLTLALELSDHYCRERITDCYRKARSTRFYGIAIELLHQARDQKQLVLYVEMSKHTIEFGVYFYQQGHYKSATDLRRSKFGRDQLQQFTDQLGLAVEADGALLNPPLAKCPLPFVSFELEAMQRLAQPAERLTLIKAVAQEAKKLYAKFPRA
jgi:hypothetical protein